MPLQPRRYNLNFELYWPVRANIAPATLRLDKVDEEKAADVLLDYVPVLTVGDVTFAANTWTRVRGTFERVFAKNLAAFASWCGDHGRQQLVDDALRVQNRAVDLIKSAHPYHHDLACIRHFGPAEWPYIRFACRGRTVSELANSFLRAPVAAAPLQLSIKAPPPVHVRSLLKACDLV